jgi:hypothetical protein
MVQAFLAAQFKFLKLAHKFVMVATVDLVVVALVALAVVAAVTVDLVLHAVTTVTNFLL